jgi:5,10-methylenetetrahydromethanopterin reductase
MRISLMGGSVAGGDQSFGGQVKAATEVAESGFHGYWVAQGFGLDSLALLTVLGREVPGIEFGTAVIPIQTRHPATMAGGAQAVAAATGGRFTLGIGLSHPVVVKDMWGMSFDRPVHQMQEYLSVLNPALAGEPVSFKGDTVTFRGQLGGGPYPAVPLVLAALGPQMLRLAGRHADGTVTWMTGPNTLAGHTVPTIAKAAAEAGRPAPRVIAGLPVVVTDDEAANRERAGRLFGFYNDLPSYRAMLDREGLAGPADVAVIGDEAHVGAVLDRLAADGVTDLLAAESAQKSDRARTREFLAARARGE